MLVRLGEDKIYKNKWHPKFDYKKVVIPEACFPVHPNSKNADLR